MENNLVELNSTVLEQIINDLRKQGYSIQDRLFSPSLMDGLEQEIRNLSETQMHSAGIGRQQDFQIANKVRSDRVCWIDGDSSATNAFLSSIEQLKTALNRQLLLGLFDYEAHFAQYAEGAFYDKHIDAFKGKTNRVLSTVLYLNNEWHQDDGGELVLFDEHNIEQEIEHVLPQKGRFIVFLSECFYHKVNPAKKTRYSIAGWFRINNSVSGQLDPSR